jgi:SAM-dependent methyltransferase
METLRASIKYAPYYIGLTGFIYRDRLFDWKYGVETRSRVSLNDLDISYESKGFGRNYGPSDPVIFKDMLSCLKIKHEDFTFVDFGSGKGRAILMASEFPFKRIIGIEFSEKLNVMARNNLGHYKSRTQKCRDIEVIESDATAYEIPNERAVLYFNNPFIEPIMAKVLENIKRSLQEHPREIFIAYSYGTPEMDKFVESSTFLRKVASTCQYFIYQNRA